MIVGLDAPAPFDLAAWSELAPVELGGETPTPPDPEGGSSPTLRIGRRLARIELAAGGALVLYAAGVAALYPHPIV